MPRSYNGTACRDGRYFIIDTLSSDTREENRYLSNLRNESADTSRWENRINVTASNLIESQSSHQGCELSLGIGIERARDAESIFVNAKAFRYYLQLYLRRDIAENGRNERWKARGFSRLLIPRGTLRHDNYGYFIYPNHSLSQRL